MKKFLSLFLLVCMLFTCLIACDTADVPKDSDSEEPATELPEDTSDTEADSESETDAQALTEANLYAGYARACITPDWSVRLDGYPGTPRYSTEVLDDLYASCTAVKDKDGNVVLFYSVDICHIGESNSTKLRKLIAGEVGIEYNNVFLSTSHSHTSPYDFEVIDLLKEKFVEIAKLAIEDLSPCKLYGGVNEVEEMNFVRRYICEDGKIYGFTDSPIARHESEGDHQMLMLKFEREGKKDIVFVNWTAHCDSIVATGKRTSISSDWVGPARDYVEKRNDAYLSTFIGAAGDMGTISYIRGEGNWNGYYQYGLDLGKIIETQMKNDLKEIDSSNGIKVTSNKVRMKVDKDFDHLWSEIEPLLNQYNSGDKEGALKGLEAIGLRLIDAQRAEINHWSNEYMRIELSAISIGDVGFAVAPYEMFSGTGLQIKAASEFDITFVCAYTNGAFGYIPTAEAVPNEGYGVYNSHFYPGAGEQLGGVLVDLLSEIHG